MIFPILFAAALASTGAAEPPPAPPRLVTLGAAVTETTAALGLEAQIVAVDTTSRWPESLTAKPRVGYLRTLPSEGMLALRPTLVVADADAGPEATLSALRSGGVDLRVVPAAITWPQARARMQAIGEAVGRGAGASRLIRGLDTRLNALAARLEDRPRPRVLFLFAHGRSPVVAGSKSVADTMIALAGADNALPHLEGHKAPTAEAVAVASPDVILTTDRVLAGLGGRKGIASMPALVASAAAREGRIVAMDGALLLGLGPRTAEAAERLASLLHPGLEATAP